GPGILDDLVRRITDFERGIAVVHRVLIARDADHHGVKAFLHLVVGAQVQGGVAIAAPGRIAAPGAIQIVVYAPFAVGTDKVVRLYFTVEIETVSNPAGDLRLTRIFGGKRIDIGFDAALVSAIGQGAHPDAEPRAQRRSDLVDARRVGDIVGFLR